MDGLVCAVCHAVRGRGQRPSRAPGSSAQIRTPLLTRRTIDFFLIGLPLLTALVLPAAGSECGYSPTSQRYCEGCLGTTTASCAVCKRTGVCGAGDRTGWCEGDGGVVTGNASACGPRYCGGFDTCHACTTVPKPDDGSTITPAPRRGCAWTTDQRCISYRSSTKRFAVASCSDNDGGTPSSRFDVAAFSGAAAVTTSLIVVSIWCMISKASHRRPDSELTESLAMDIVNDVHDDHVISSHPRSLRSRSKPPSADGLSGEEDDNLQYASQRIGHLDQHLIGDVG